ncbi:MAG TPA: peptidoglycan recognition family protein [Gaiellaceae bacterium]|nr:peptidoglycan recognition family protein [Gaiellaceae bacterium]
MLAALLAALALAGGTAPAPPRPHIVWKPIPFGAKRLAETAAYAKKHYGIDSYVLRPQAIVEHVTASPSFASVYAYFAADVPDPELHVLPAPCAHFVIDTDGTIYQLVRTNVICRHTVGLNWAAIGIEHVGLSDAQVMGDAAQMRSSLALTAWLMWKYDIPLRSVIGHNESLTSPLHKELYAPWRCQTHGDWRHADMVVYRAKLAALAKRDGLHVGPTFVPRPSHC